MKKFNLKLAVEQIAMQLNAETNVVSNTMFDNVADLIEANPQSICFYENAKFIDQLKATKAGLIVVPKDFDSTIKPDTNLIFVDKPYINFLMLVKQWLKLSEVKPNGEVHPSAVISENCVIAEKAIIGPHTFIGKNVKIGNNTILEANVSILDNCNVGDNCHVFPNVTIYHDSIIGDNCIIHAGCVIGADGFGFLFHDGKQIKIPQVGNVIIENNVEIGANSTIDRATLSSTVIGEGTKIDNLVQVGHNCKIGNNSILCAQVGLAGSTIIGDVVYLGGQVGVGGHLTINNYAMIGAQSGVSNDVPEKAKYFGTPAIDAGLKKRIIAMEKHIPEVIKAYRKREKNKVKK